MIQTGNESFSEDIEVHRRIMKCDYLEEDKQLITAPSIFTYPCSPHLAAKIDNKKVDLEKIKSATGILESRFDVVLLEGAGGLMVPITEDYMTVDYIKDNDYPVILVTSGKLGSLNHTLLTLDVIKNRGIRLHSIVYNLYPKIDPVIEADSLVFLKNHLAKHFPGSEITTIDEI